MVFLLRRIRLVIKGCQEKIKYDNVIIARMEVILTRRMYNTIVSMCGEGGEIWLDWCPVPFYEVTGEKKIKLVPSQNDPDAVFLSDDVIVIRLTPAGRLGRCYTRFTSEANRRALRTRSMRIGSFFAIRHL